MKKLFILVAAALFTVSANAQLYVGGRLGLDVDGNKSENAAYKQNSCNLNFNLSPEVGYYLSDKLAVGGYLNITTSFRSSEYLSNIEIEGVDVPDIDGNSTSIGWSIEPYVKYKFWGIGKFGIWGQADVYIGTGGDVSAVPFVNYGFAVLPVLTYDFNEHFTLDAYIDCVSLRYDGSCQVDKKNDVKNTRNSFGLGAATRGSIVSVGFHYNF